MRRLAVLVVSCASATAIARPTHAPAEFWAEVAEPHGDEARRIVAAARQAMRIADDALQVDAAWAVEQRMDYFRDAHRLLRHARTLSPHNAEVLLALGRAADEVGDTRGALDALTAYVGVVGRDRATPEAIGRLGEIHLRLGDRDTAIDWLRLAQGPLRPETVVATVHLANALAARGEIAAAVDVIVSSVPPQAMSYYSQELLVALFTLAVIYDRDEQQTNAFEVLHRMRQTLQQTMGSMLHAAIGGMRFAPAEDQHYYVGLLHEVLDHPTEARAAFALYAASGDAPWRRRALAHVRALDAQRARVRPSTPALPGGRP